MDAPATFQLGDRIRYFGRGPLNNTAGTVTTPRVHVLAERWVTAIMDRDGMTWDLMVANVRPDMPS